ncbi:MAG: 50S ribosomal protein L11 methyltransferase [Verrucomicrobiota bacterium]
MTTSLSQPLTCVEVCTDAERGPSLDELLTSVAPAGSSSYTDPVANRATVRVWVPENTSASKLADDIRRILDQAANWIGDPPPAVDISEVRQEDWAETWKRHFHTQRVSRRIVIKPSWELYAPEATDIVLELDPGMSFGTGQHETTKACLQMLDDLAETLTPCPLLDAGCGSGILTLAAVRLGFQPVLAFDHDPQATLMARENLANAGVLDRVRIQQADLTNFDACTQFPIVVANILAPVLMECAETLTRHLAPAPSSRMLLSGILDDQYADVRKRFEQCGLQESTRVKLGEWTSGCFHLT